MNWQPKWTTKERYMLLDDFEGEIWKHFNYWKGHKLKDYYYISNLGRLKSLCPFHKHKILVGTLDYTTGGYVATLVRTAENGQIGVSYHQAVARYFIGDPPEDILDPVVDHIDSDKLDNRCSNLQWLEIVDNTKKALKEGKCDKFMHNGGWNRKSCKFVEFSDIEFRSLQEAAYFIGRNSDYVGECLRLGRPIKDKVHNVIVHVVKE